LILSSVETFKIALTASSTSANSIPPSIIFALNGGGIMPVSTNLYPANEY
jgi:hypothetical protein